MPFEVNGKQAGELTYFRTEDSHALCDPEDLKAIKKDSKTMYLFIPSKSLVGYDPREFKRLGFTYRLHRSKRASQHFSVTTEEFRVDQQPSLWCSLRLVDAKDSSI